MNNLEVLLNKVLSAALLRSISPVFFLIISFVLSLVLSLSFTRLALAETNSQETNSQVKPHMQDFYKITNKIRPYLINKAQYLNSQNEKEIAQYLTEFNEKVDKLKKEKMSESDDMKYRAQQLSEGLNEAEKSFKDGFKDYSYWVLKSSMNNCFACHTQKNLSGTEYKFSQSSSADPYSEAEFLFIVRNYSESIALFESFIVKYPDNKISVENLENSLQKILYYYVRVLREDQKTLATFEVLLKNQKLPATVRNDILAWKKYLNVKKYRLIEEKSLTTAKSLKDFISERDNIASHYKLSNQRYIVDLETSYYLFQLLEKSTDIKLKPWILYWLAYQEKDYRLTMFDLSAEQYLKECIEKYTNHKAAKKCFALYKEITINSYTGSRGTSLPKSVADQLTKYEKMVHKK